jgi:hypothetical protein
VQCLAEYSPLASFLSSIKTSLLPAVQRNTPYGCSVPLLGLPGQNRTAWVPKAIGVHVFYTSEVWKSKINQGQGSELVDGESSFLFSWLVNFTFSPWPQEHGSMHECLHECEHLDMSVCVCVCVREREREREREKERERELESYPTRIWTRFLLDKGPTLRTSLINNCLFPTIPLSILTRQRLGFPRITFGCI